MLHPLRGCRGRALPPGEDGWQRFDLRVQTVKPRQCLIYPFWPRLLASKQAFDEGTLSCPGTDAGEAPLFLPEEMF